MPPPPSPPQDLYGCYQPHQLYSTPLLPPQYPTLPYYIPEQPQLYATPSYSTLPPQYHQIPRSSPPMYLQQQHHTASYLFDDMTERKVAHGDPKSEVYVLDEMYEQNLLRDKEKKEEDESKQPTTEGFLGSSIPEVSILDFDASLPVEDQDYSEDLSLISESGTNSSPISSSKNFGSVSADSRVVNSSIGKTARVKEVTSFVPTNGCTLSEGIDQVHWKVNKYQLKGITMGVEAALSPSKRLHRALEAMTANAAEATVHTAEAAGGMELASNGCTEFLATENILSSAMSTPRIQSCDKTNELVLGTLATPGHGYPMLQSSLDVNHSNEQLKVNGEMTNIAPWKLSVSIAEMCWMFEDERGTKHGPHSHDELLNWHQSSYLQDSLMIYHVDSKLGPFTLATLADMWSTYKSACPCSSMLEEEITAMLGAVPRRYGWNGGEIGFDAYFSMARGNATLPAMEMTKWFDTDHHFIIHEMGPDTRFFIVLEMGPYTKFSYSSHKTVSEYKEAKGLGIETIFVLIGPVPYLLLSKPKKGVDKSFSLLTLMGDSVQLKAAGASWIQFDEPTLVLDLDDSKLQAFTTAYSKLESLLSGEKNAEHFSAA